MIKILLITDRLPGEQLGGGSFKTKKMIEYFSKSFELKTLSLSSSSDEISSDEVNTILPLANKRFKPSLFNLFLSYYYRIPLSVFRNRANISSSLYSNIFDWCDLVIVDHFFMFDYIPNQFAKKIILHQHNAEYLMWERQSKNEKSYIKSIMLRFESIRVKTFERKICNKSDLVFAAPNDIEVLSKIGLDRQKFRTTLHLGDDSLYKYPIPDFANMSNNITFLGGLDWAPNKDAVLWFIDHCFNKISTQCDNVNLFLIGNIDTALKQKYQNHNNIFFLGYVDDLNIQLSNTKVFISPLRFGSGMKVKNITAMYRGLPIVTTPIGAEGIELKNHWSALISEGIEDFTNSVIELLVNDVKCKELACHAKKLAHEKYTWDAMMASMIFDINEAI